MADPNLNTQRNLQPKSDQGIVQFPRRAASARRQDSSMEYDQELQGFVEEQEERANVVRFSQSMQQVLPQQKSVQYRIAIPVAFLLAGLAAIMDLAEIILFFTTGVGGFVKDIASWLFIGIFWMLKAPFWKGNKWMSKASTMIGTYLVGLVPVMSDFLPELTIGILVTIAYTRIEDRLGSTIGVAKELNEKIVRFKRDRNNRGNRAA